MQGDTYTYKKARCQGLRRKLCEVIGSKLCKGCDYWQTTDKGEGRCSNYCVTLQKKGR